VEFLVRGAISSLFQDRSLIFVVRYSHLYYYYYVVLFLTNLFYFKSLECIN